MDILIAEAGLVAESRLGELIEKMTEGKPRHTSVKGSVGGSSKSLPDNITHKQSHEAG